MEDNQELVESKARITVLETKVRELKFQVKEVKTELKVEKQLYRKLYRTLKKQSRGESRFSQLWREAKLAAYQKLVSKASRLQQQANDPVGTQADTVVNDIGQVIDHLSNKENLSELEVKAALGSLEVLEQVVKSQLGALGKNSKAALLIDRAKGLVGA